MKWKLSLLVPATALILTACAQVPVASDSTDGLSSGAERPYAERSPSNDAEAAAKKHVELGLAYIGIARYDVALDEAKTALRFTPDYPPAHHLMGVVYLFINDMPNAKASLERALSLAPGDPEVQNTYGWYLCLTGAADKAQHYFNSSARNPYYRYATRPLTNSGRCYMRSKDYVRAKTSLEQAVQVDPNNSDAVLDLAEVSYRLKDYDGARRNLIEFNRLREPTAASIWLGVRTERARGNREAEASYAEQLRNRFPDSPETKKLNEENYE